MFSNLRVAVSPFPTNKFIGNNKILSLLVYSVPLKTIIIIYFSYNLCFELNVIFHNNAYESHRLYSGFCFSFLCFVPYIHQKPIIILIISPGIRILMLSIASVFNVLNVLIYSIYNEGLLFVGVRPNEYKILNSILPHTKML